jgi:hypothetical protein
MSAIGGRAAPHVDDDIQDAPPQDHDQLGLRMRWSLKVQTAERAGASRIRMIILDKATTDAEIIQTLLMEGFAEPAARIKMALGRRDPGQVGRIQGRGTHDSKAVLLN